MGDPLERTQVGWRGDLRVGRHMKSLEQGAKLLLGGRFPKKGAFYPPTVLADVKAWWRMRKNCSNTVASVIVRAEAIATANDSVFGLGAAVFTRDAAQGSIAAEGGRGRVCQHVRALRSPAFGGVKESGYGRDRHYRIKEFVNIKTVYVR